MNHCPHCGCGCRSPSRWNDVSIGDGIGRRWTGGPGGVMTEREIETARQLLASPSFKWTGGMVDEGGWRVSFAGDGFIQCQGTLAGHPRIQHGRGEFLPDIADDGTRGALEGLACRLWGDPGLYIMEEWGMHGATPVWRVHTGRGRLRSSVCGEGATKGEAWARAVIAAPK